MRRPSLAAALLVLGACTSTDPQVSRGTSVENPTVSTEGLPADSGPVDSTPPDSSPDDTGAPVAIGTLDWGSCDNADYAPGVECASLEVPFDYDDPSSATITLALTRLPATGDAAGSILLNPGGPGGSGNEFLAEQLAFDPAQFGDLTESFDLVGFDPRGVGDSSPIDCVDDAWLEAHEFVDPTPDTPEEQAALDNMGPEFTSGCEANTTGDLAEYDTINTARDMDLLREAVGDDRLTFYGASYGTFLGGVYATLFPDHVRAMVLDGAYYPTGEDEFESNRTQLLGFEQAFANWAADCQANEACPFHADDVSARWLALRSQLDQTPAPGADGRSANEAAVVDGTIAALYSKSTWGPLSQALAAAEGGDGTALLTLADLLNGREIDGSWSNLNEANRVLNCTSGLVGGQPVDIEAKVASLKQEAPHFGYSATVDDFTRTCEGLPAAGPTTIEYAGPGPILVTGGKNDPATPFVYAELLSAVLGPEATLLTFTGEGHTSLGSSDCVTAAAESVLGDAERAADGIVCDENPPTPAPDWFADLPTVTTLTPYLLDDAAGLFGFERGTYVAPFTSSADRDEAVSAIADAFSAAGWEERGRQSVPFGDEEGTMILFGSDAGELQILILGKAVVASPELGPIGGLLPPDSSLILYIAF